MLESSVWLNQKQLVLGSGISWRRQFDEQCHMESPRSSTSTTGRPGWQLHRSGSAHPGRCGKNVVRGHRYSLTVLELAAERPGSSARNVAGSASGANLVAPKHICNLALLWGTMKPSVGRGPRQPFMEECVNKSRVRRGSRQCRRIVANLCVAKCDSNLRFGEIIV